MTDQKRLHLVFGHTSNGVLLQSGLINPETEDVILLADSLSLGPLADVDDEQRTEERRLWWAHNVNEPQDGTANTDFIEEDRTRIKKLTTGIPQYQALYLWFGEDTNEKIAMARVLHHIREIDIPIFKPDFHQVHVKNIRGETINPTTLYLMTAADVPVVAKHFYELTTQDRLHWQSRWEQLRSDEADFHIFDKSDNIIAGDHRFFDTFLLEACTPEPKNSPLIVGHALMAIWNTYGMPGIGDAFLFRRLNQLETEGTIEITMRHEDPTKRYRIFNVRLC